MCPVFFILVLNVISCFVFLSIVKISHQSAAIDLSVFWYICVQMLNSFNDRRSHKDSYQCKAAASLCLLLKFFFKNRNIHSLFKLNPDRHRNHTGTILLFCVSVCIRIYCAMLWILNFITYVMILVCFEYQ